ncbi:CdaR family protein [Planococcus kocurii]|uniref:CdaR family protein n=1 Tax=Planococcus kocurii TaxID=1374 RepID=UPI003CFC8DE5
MDKMMDNRWFLRITALLLAFLLFFSVQADDNSAVTTDTSRVSEVIEEVELEVYHDNSLMVSGVPKTADLHLSGPVSVVQTARQLEDFTLFVDLRNLPMGEHQVPIQTENLSEQLTVRVDPAFVNVVIEERVSQEFRVDPEINERMLADGYILDNVSVDPETVIVTGPKSMIDAISFVKATVSGEQGVKESFNTAARVRVLAEDLTKLESAEIEPAEVEVAVEVVEYSKTVPVRIEPIGKAGTGITIKNWSTTTEEIQIFGPKSVVDEITEYVVEADAALVTAKDSTLEVELDIPAGASAVSPGQVTVEAETVIDDSAKRPTDQKDSEVVDNTES